MGERPVRGHACGVRDSGQGGEHAAREKPPSQELAEIDRLGTNMLTVEAGRSLTGGEAQLPSEAPARIMHLDNVQLVTHAALMKEEKVYRSSMIPKGNSGGLQVRATSLNLLSVLGTGVARGNWLNEGTAREPVAVLGSADAKRLGISRVYPDQRIWLGDQWFNVAGILEPSPLTPEIDNSALIGYTAAQDTSATSASYAARSRPARQARSTCEPPPVMRRRYSRCSRGPPTPRRRTR